MDRLVQFDAYEAIDLDQQSSDKAKYITPKWVMKKKRGEDGEKIKRCRFVAGSCVPPTFGGMISLLRAALVAQAGSSIFLLRR